MACEAFYRRKHPNVSFGKVCVTNQFFNAQVKENAHLNSVELLDRQHLGDLLEAHETTMLEVQRMLFADW
ncbi:hypothetical protein [Burkholderia vietnamiensis]|uniref:hypothetical protein n=1 Tax=Burkholderia vietnamiensis TaxID=60552 RepID=UPI0012DAB7E1|nr:hypothetical protein [Burkholderia vietnamiensis]MCA8072095.1 hypothetical protein [Burkholderia vietnamiensis]MCA8290685.1 hypothetical protein [Burkholderia vietnamiensis]